MKIIW